MTWPNPLSVQNEQRRNLADLIARRGWDSVILIGDFNAAAPSVALTGLNGKPACNGGLSAFQPGRRPEPSAAASALRCQICRVW
ncbi:hypothetical protein HXX25_06845 [Hyphobacterium sp. CCMP332]|uniref:hypothetical protein n=1 Tax=Hyphobacterium sp. CCMP332 TaxID=2749086 RepID=UPI00164FAF36|nr:hypothetical protein [Hyphobacterium sp. CCMP332]QNL19052.1 hypothetical protein HXX25_06845 [Hyphobacterium sp. CCMP332]